MTLSPGNREETMHRIMSSASQSEWAVYLGTELRSLYSHSSAAVTFHSGTVLIWTHIGHIHMNVGVWFPGDK